MNMQDYNRLVEQAWELEERLTAEGLFLDASTIHALTMAMKAAVRENRDNVVLGAPRLPKPAQHRHKHGADGKCTVEGCVALSREAKKVQKMIAAREKNGAPQTER